MCTVDKKNSISIMYWNAQGIKTKLDELTRFLTNNKCDVVCLCETFLKNNNTLHINNYKCIRKDRLTGRLGGLAIIIKSSIQYNEIQLPRTDLLECMGIEIVCDNRKVILINSYLPGGATDKQINDNYNNDLIALTSRTEPYFIVGDLNSKHTSWNNMKNNTAGTILHTASSLSNFLIYHPDEHTYCPMSTYKRPSTIDLLISNGKVNILDLTVRKIFSSDHIPVMCKAEISLTLTSVQRYNFHKADWKLF